MSKFTQRERERALFRYCNALERGDFDVVAEVLRLAERDSDLVRMIAEVNEELAVELPRQRSDVVQTQNSGGIEQVITRGKPSLDGRTPNHNHHQKANASLINPYQDTLRKGSRRLQLLTGIAAALVLILFGTLLVNVPSEPTGATLLTDVQLTETAKPVGCQLIDTTADLQSESMRLAQAANGANADLAVLLGICALQTGYSSEADEALQFALYHAGRLPVIRGHEGNVTSAMYSPDGKTILTASFDGTARLWNAQTLAEIRRLEHPAEVATAMFSPDGRNILTAAVEGKLTLRLWETASGSLVRTITSNYKGAREMDYAPDGRFALTADEDMTVRLWDLETGEQTLVVDPDPSIPEPFPGGVAFSPDGRYMVTLGEGNYTNIINNLEEGILQEWNLETGEPARQFTSNDLNLPFLSDIEISPDMRYMVTSTVNEIVLWDYQTGEEIRVLAESPGYKAAFSPDGQYVLAGVLDAGRGKSKLWEVSTGRLLRVFTANAGISGSFSPDGRRVVLVEYQGILSPAPNSHPTAVLYDTDYHDFIAYACTKVTRDFTAEERAQFSLSDSAVTCPQLGHRPTLMLGPTAAPTLAPPAIVEAKWAGCQLVNAPDALAENRRLVREARGQFLLRGESSTELGALLSICALQTAYTLEADEILQNLFKSADFLPTISTPEQEVYSVEFSPDGKTILTGNTAAAWLWDAETLAEIRQFQHPTSIVRATFSPDGRYILTTGGPNDPSVRVWETATGNLIRTFIGHERDEEGEVRAVFSPDGKFVLSAGTDATARLWNLATGEETRIFHHMYRYVWGLAFTPDGRHVLTSSGDHVSPMAEGEKVLQEWDIQTGEPIRQFEGTSTHRGISDIQFSPDGRSMLTSSALPALWDYQIGQETHVFPENWHGTSSYVTFAPDGRLIFFGNSSLESRSFLANSVTDFPVRVFLTGGGFSFLPAMADFSPDGRRLATTYRSQSGGESHTTVLIYDTDYHDFIAFACTKLTRDFTPEERAKYGVSDVSPTCPQFGEGEALPPGMTPMPMQPIPVWTPLPTLANTTP